MIKDYLKENQPLFYRIIENEFNLKKIPHAFLLVGNNTDQPLQFLTMSLICNETLACEQCIDCQKVLNHQYADIIEIDGEEESIKKKHIENIQETFKKSSLEGKAKVYILKNVEKTTKEAMNALLKILEEPTEGIYAIFTTKNINRILPTIISRCQVIELKPDNKEVLKEKLIAKGYEEEKASVLSYIIKDEDDLENLFDYLQEQFEDIQIEDLKQPLIHFANKLEIILNQKIDYDTLIGLLIHIICLIDRLKKHLSPAVHFQAASDILTKDRSTVEKVKEILLPIEQICRITISDVEAATIISIIKGKEQ